LNSLEDGKITVGIHEDHNAGIAAVKGDKLIMYCEFERLTRIKNQSGRFPELVMKYLTQLPLEEIGAICAPDPSFIIDQLVTSLGAIPGPDMRVNIGDHSIRIYGQDDLHPFMHVLAALPLDGVSPGLYAVLVFDAEQPRFGWIDLRESLRPPLNMLFYTVSYEKWFNGEIFASLYGKLFYNSYNLSHCGKLMGLASWGRPRCRYISWLGELAQRHFDPLPPTWQGYSSASSELLIQEMTALIKADPRQHDHPSIIDLAASAQELFTHELVQQVIRGMEAIREDLHQRHLPQPIGLIYGGGCALSVVSNEMLREVVDLPIFIPPYAHDASQFVGAALWASLAMSPQTWHHSRWNGIPCHTEGRVTVDQLASIGMPIEKASPQDIAHRIVAGQLIALIEGGSEAGPRALGKRSLLANALDPNMRDRINHEVKMREWYRPFAPALPAEVFPAYFDAPASPASQYMLDAYHLKPKYRALLSSVSSPDGTARPQAVISEKSPWYYDLLLALGSHTGHPIVLNTSLNAPGKTIAFDLTQSLQDCAALGVDAAVIDGAVLDKDTIIRLATSLSSH
jgi:predicted NodU family carbamoyl transferase